MQDFMYLRNFMTQTANIYVADCDTFDVDIVSRCRVPWEFLLGFQ